MKILYKILGIASLFIVVFSFINFIYSSDLSLNEKIFGSLPSIMMLVFIVMALNKD